MQSRVFTLCTFLLLCLSSLALPFPAPAPAPADGLWAKEPVEVVGTSDLAELKFINTLNYYWNLGLGSFVVVTASDATYTLKVSWEILPCGLSQVSPLYRMRKATIMDTEMLLVADGAGTLQTYPLHPTQPATCPTVKKVETGSGYVTLDVHESVAMHLSSTYDRSSQQLKYLFTVFEMKAVNQFTVEMQGTQTQTISLSNNITNNHNMATVVKIGTKDINETIVFVPKEGRGITAYYGPMLENDITANTPLAAAFQCFRVTRIRVEAEVPTHPVVYGTVTLAAACADNGAGKPAVYVVQVPVVDGVPQTLEVIDIFTLDDADDFDDFSLYGGMAYLDGSLVLATSHYVYNFMIPDPESSAPTLTLRSCFKSRDYTLTDVDLLTPNVAVLSTHSLTTPASPVVLDLASGAIVQKPVEAVSNTDILGQFIGSVDQFSAVLRLSDTSFITAGGNGAIRRWESCAGLGHDYTAALVNTSNSKAPSATCICPADKYCLLGAVLDTCPDHTTKVGGKCEADNQWFIDPVSLSVITCPAGNICTNNEKVTCPDGQFAADDAGDYVTESATQCLSCPAGYKCKGGIRTHCANTQETRFYQPDPNQTKCLPCSDKNNYEHLISATSTTCDYCPSNEYRSSTGCHPCDALTGANFCLTIHDRQERVVQKLLSCNTHQWRVSPYQCRDCLVDEICHGDGTYTWKFRLIFDLRTRSGKITVGVSALGAVVVVAIMVCVARHVYQHKQDYPEHENHFNDMRVTKHAEIPVKIETEELCYI